MRKMISFKVENLPEKQQKIIDDWANGQTNIQQSLANIVMHVVAFTGNDDVMDFDVQRKLHLKFGKGEVAAVVQKQAAAPQPKQVEVPKSETVTNDIYKTEWFNTD